MSRCLADKVKDYYAARAPVYDETAGYEDHAAEQLRGPIKTRYQEWLRGHRVLELACGTGYWTEVICKTAESVLATDVNPSMISIARKRLAWARNVRFQVADAYSLGGVEGGFSAAFAIWWWSHVPKGLLSRFLDALHSKLQVGAFVFFVDQLPDAYVAKNRRQNEAGDLVEERTLPDGSKFQVVKNFPTEQEILNLLVDRATGILYHEYPEEHSWNLSYTVT